MIINQMKAEADKLTKTTSTTKKNGRFPTVKLVRNQDFSTDYRLKKVGRKIRGRKYFATESVENF